MRACVRALPLHTHKHIRTTTRRMAMTTAAAVHMRLRALNRRINKQRATDTEPLLTARLLLPPVPPLLLLCCCYSSCCSVCRCPLALEWCACTRCCVAHGKPGPGDNATPTARPPDTYCTRPGRFAISAVFYTLCPVPPSSRAFLVPPFKGFVDPRILPAVSGIPVPRVIERYPENLLSLSPFRSTPPPTNVVNGAGIFLRPRTAYAYSKM